ncbi:dynamin family protein [Thalassobacillus devorans]|uniref:dynamin family protein n=1 Tax=Thalassobacillus devorans TaxID=279813 RepID=UPI000A1C9729|nr:dynamin family protein [Thalassobacillus devorans]
MNVTTKSSQLTKEAQSLSGLYHELNRQGNDWQAEKVLDLIDKWERQQVMIGFAGHFSAGKSTMINTLLEEEILPSSPIPTSANVVKLQSGDDYTRVFYRDDRPAQYEGKPDMETIQSLCKDGDEIVSLEISQKDAKLSSHVTMIDTPGVDSTNDADRVITESSLHLMDYMYYVMDYNHVQSEVNLTFLQEMQKKGLPFSIIVNQVDKHQESELSFPEFQTSVSEALENWQLTPDKIFYTTLMAPELAINELSMLKSHLTTVTEISAEEREASITRSASLILEDSVDEVASDFEDKKVELLEKMEGLQSTTPDEKREQVQSEIQRLENREEEAEALYEERVLSLFKNAYLMPTTLREDAERYLESMQPGFKVGLMFTKKKTEEEREQRKETFYNHLMKIVEKNLRWPLRDRLLEVVEAYPVTGSQVTERIQNLDADYPKQALEDLIDSGAKVTNTYVLVYTDKVADDVKRTYKSYVKGIWEEIKQAIRDDASQKIQGYDDVKQSFGQLEQYQKELEGIEHTIESYRAGLWHAFTEKTPESGLHQQIQVLLKEREENIRFLDAWDPDEQKNHQEEAVHQPDDVELPEQDHIDKNATLRVIDQVIETVEGTPGFKELTLQLDEKGSRLKQQEFTVALFGAFSAGKSSFANALIKEKLLPVSPNPTTATINKIAPPNEKYEHGSIIVKMKTEAQMIEDLTSITSFLGMEERELPAVLDQLAEVKSNEFIQLAHKQRSFVEAVLDGYKEASDNLGAQLKIGLDEFPAYVADEKKSCFVEWMQVHYDCPLTRKGITLVDTPGADSVNARHTDVAFEYIRSADAVLFITYYNHPFSKADESFLTQLGRVKDAFSMDKMFFLINAADLARSEKELAGVLEYMKEQLLRFQIRNPQIFPVSSLYALREDLDEEEIIAEARDGFPEFEKRFYTFIEKELPQVLIRSIHHDFARTKSRMEAIIADASLNQEARQKKVERNKAEKSSMLDTLAVFNYRQYETMITQKIEKQVYYIHQRLLLNFNDYFKHHFNPATIKGSGKEAKTQLEMASEALEQEVTYEFNQELRAVSLRIEAFLNDSLLQMNQDLERHLQEIRDKFELGDMDSKNLEHPAFDFQIAFDAEQTKAILQKFKGTKKFFEQNEKELVKEDLKEAVDPIIKAQLQQAEQDIQDKYRKQWKEIVERFETIKTEEISEYYDGLNYNLEHPIDIEALKTKNQTLAQFV